MPAVWDGVAERMHSPALVQRRLIRGSEDDSRSAYGYAHCAGAYNTHSYCARRLIARAGDYRRALKEAGRCRTGPGNMAHHLRRLRHARQKPLLNLKGFEHLL